MGLITGIVPQETFPQEDLSPDNAELLALMLANRTILTDAHREVERISGVYRYAHPALRETVSRFPDLSDSARSAFNLGIVVYEAMAGFVRMKPRAYDLRLIVDYANTALVAAEGSARVENYFEEADAAFRVGRPNACEVVREAAERFYPVTVDYATYGAAVACQFELDLANPTR